MIISYKTSDSTVASEQWHLYRARIAREPGLRSARRGGWGTGCVLAVALAGPAAGAGSVSSLLACRDIADSARRLACFDREAAALAPTPAAPASSGAAAPALAATPAPGAAPPASAPVAPTSSAVPPAPAAAALPARDARQDFGLSEGAVEQQEVAAGARPMKLSKIEAHLVRTARTSDGHLLFTLDNDQAWRQVQAEDMLVQPGEAVTISRAALGSYWLKMSSGRGCKVTRVR